MVEDLLSLLFDDGFVLVADHLFFLLEIGHYLLEGLLQDSNLVFVLVDLLVLKFLAFDVFLLGALVDVDVSFEALVGLAQLPDLFFVVFDAVSLADSLLVELLVVQVDPLLDFLDVFLRILRRLTFEAFKALVEVLLLLLLLPCHLDLVVVFELGDLVLQILALGAPLKHLDFKYVHLPEDLLHRLDVLAKFVDLNVALL